MKTRARKNTINLALKIAIIESRKTQRSVSVLTGIPEVRLSGLVRGKLLASPKERDTLSRVLQRQSSTLFPEVAL